MTSPDRGPAPHILLADDDDFVGFVLETVLAERGFRVSRAPDGLQALDIDAVDPADCLVTDIRMPRMDGVALIDALRRRSPGLPVVVVSGSTREAAPVLEALPALSVLPKPARPEDVAAAVETLLDLPAGHGAKV